MMKWTWHHIMDTIANTIVKIKHQNTNNHHHTHEPSVKQTHNENKYNLQLTRPDLNRTKMRNNFNLFRIFSFLVFLRLSLWFRTCFTDNRCIWWNIDCRWQHFLILFQLLPYLDYGIECLLSVFSNHYLS